MSTPGSPTGERAGKHLCVLVPHEDGPPGEMRAVCLETGEASPSANEDNDGDPSCFDENEPTWFVARLLWRLDNAYCTGASHEVIQ